MSGIVLKGNRYSGNTIVSNCFIDDYMADANGAQLKIYLYLMRCIEADEPVTVSLLADRFNYMETDIRRSLLYWARKGVISLEFDDEENISGIILNDPAEACETEVTIPRKRAEKHRKPTYSADDLKKFSADDDIKQLIFVAEQYLKKPLTPTEMKTMLFIYDGLGFSADLIEYLIEYCVGKGKTSMRYIESTAMNWAEDGVKTVIDAKGREKCFGGSDYSAVLRAFGITDRKPAAREIDYIDSWKNECGFSLDIILEAAGRTIMRTSKPSFQYADRILRGWAESGVRSMEDIDSLDEAYSSRMQQGFRTLPQSSTAMQGGRTGSPVRKKGGPAKGHFDMERQYDFDEIEASLLGRRQG